MSVHGIMKTIIRTQMSMNVPSNWCCLFAVEIVPSGMATRPETRTVQVDQLASVCLCSCLVFVVKAMAVNISGVLVFHDFLCLLMTGRMITRTKKDAGQSETNSTWFFALKVVPHCVATRPETRTVQMDFSAFDKFFDCFISMVTAVAFDVPSVRVLALSKK